MSVLVYDCGSVANTITATLDTSTGAMIIRGTGDIDNYANEYSPWYSDRESITQVTVDKGITRIGTGTFYNCTNLEYISIPKTVTTIGSDVFNGCTSLESIKIPKSVTAIGNGAFADSGLTEIKFFGNPPEAGTDILDNVTATGYVPEGNTEWDSLAKAEVAGNGSTITWSEFDTKPNLIEYDELEYLWSKIKDYVDTHSSGLSGTVGSSTTPIYIDNGTPTACGNSLAVSITGNSATSTLSSSIDIVSDNLDSPIDNDTVVICYATAEIDTAQLQSTGIPDSNNNTGADNLILRRRISDYTNASMVYDSTLAKNVILLETNTGSAGTTSDNGLKANVPFYLDGTSISFYIKGIKSASSSTNIFQFNIGNGGYYMEVSLTTNGQIRVEIAGPSGYGSITSNYQFDENNWYYVVTATGNTDGTALYINGEFNVSDSNLISDANYVNSSSIQFGRIFQYVDLYYTDINIYSKFLTAGNVYTLYHGGSSFTANYDRPILISDLENITTLTNQISTPIFSNKFYANPKTGIFTAKEKLKSKKVEASVELISSYIRINTEHSATSEGILFEGASATYNWFMRGYYDWFGIYRNGYNTNASAYIHYDGSNWSIGGGSLYCSSGFVGNLTGNADTATSATSAATATDATNASNVLQKNATADYNRPLMLTGIKNNTTTTNDNREVCYSNNFYANPSTGVQTATGGFSSTGSYTTSLTTSTYLAGNKGTAIINSTASAGYTVLSRMKSTNGVFTQGVHNADYKFTYTADSIISAGTNSVSKTCLTMNENGTVTAPSGVVGVTGSLPSKCIFRINVTGMTATSAAVGTVVPNTGTGGLEFKVAGAAANLNSWTNGTSGGVGTGQHFLVPSGGNIRAESSGVTIGTAFTFCAETDTSTSYWANTPTIFEMSTASDGSNAANRVFIGFNTSRQIRLVICGSDGTSYECHSTLAVASGSSARFGVSVNGNSIIFVHNGVSETATLTNTRVSASMKYFSVGNFYHAPASRQMGHVAFPTLWNQALTANQMITLLESGVLYDNNAIIISSERITGTLSNDTTGNAATATKLGTATKGNTATPIYLSSGVPTACTKNILINNATKLTAAGWYRVLNLPACWLGIVTISKGYSGGEPRFITCYVDNNFTSGKPNVRFIATTNSGGNYLTKVRIVYKFNTTSYLEIYITPTTETWTMEAIPLSATYAASAVNFTAGEIPSGYTEYSFDVPDTAGLAPVAGVRTTGSATVPTYVDANGILQACTSISLNAATATTATNANKLKTTAKTGTWLAPIGTIYNDTSGANSDIYRTGVSADLIFQTQANSANTASSLLAWCVLRIGNSIANAENGTGRRGILRLFSNTTKKVDLMPPDSLSSDIDIRLPSSAGTLALVNANTTGSSGSCTGNAASATYATNIRVAKSSADSWYYLPFITGATANTNYQPKYHPGLRVDCLDGTTTGNGVSVIQLGTSTAFGTAGNAYGRIFFYKKATSTYKNPKRVFLTAPDVAAATDSDVTVTLPNATGTLALTSSCDQAIKTDLHDVDCLDILKTLTIKRFKYSQKKIDEKQWKKDNPDKPLSEMPEFKDNEHEPWYIHTMAQEFNEAFNVDDGNPDEIKPINEIGVCLRAIQELAKQVDKLENRLKIIEDKILTLT